jgi:ppGpp synthetase/RelA/SpoT-type nucleotidyltranferase
MYVSSKLRDRFDAATSHVQAVAGEVRDTLLNLCENRGYAFQYRTKTLDSLAEKIESGRYRGWWDIDDLFGCTVIVPTLDHEPLVEEFCNTAFLLHVARRRGATDKAADVFRFDATRLYYRLRPPPDLADTNIEKYRLLFEIQIKSAFDHAWATATHDLTYKSNSIDWRRLRLAAQMKAVVEQLDAAVLSFEQMAPFIAENPDRRLKIKKEINDHFARAITENKIPDENLPRDFSRFLDNFVNLVRAGGRPAEEAVSVADQLVRSIIERDPILFPRSLSLFQFCFAEATLNSLITRTRDGYFAPITEELETLYPHIGIFRRRFSLDCR